jgi:NADH-quinone oxidoreductase subunit G
VWFTKPLNATCNCGKCAGKAVLWMKGDEIVRVTARKDQYDEVEDWICNECRFERKDLSQWTIEGPRHISRHSVISLNHYQKPADEHTLLNNSHAKEISTADDQRTEK